MEQGSIITQEQQEHYQNEQWQHRKKHSATFVVAIKLR